MTTKRTVLLSVPTYRLMGALDGVMSSFGAVKVSFDNSQHYLEFEVEQCPSAESLLYEICERYECQEVWKRIVHKDLNQRIDELMKKVSTLESVEVRQQVAATIMQYCTITTEVKPAESESDAFYIETELEID